MRELEIGSISRLENIARSDNFVPLLALAENIFASRLVGEKSFSPSRPNLRRTAVSYFGSDNQGFTISVKNVIPLCRIIVRFSEHAFTVLERIFKDVRYVRVLKDLSFLLFVWRSYLFSVSHPYFRRVSKALDRFGRGEIKRHDVGSLFYPFGVSERGSTETKYRCEET